MSFFLKGNIDPLQSNMKHSSDKYFNLWWYKSIDSILL